MYQNNHLKGKTIMDKMFFIILILNATDIFRFLALPLRVPIRIVSGVIFVLSVLYIVSKARYSLGFFQLSGFNRWFMVFLVWPLMTIIYSPLFDSRLILMQMFFFTLFFGAAVFTFVNGLSNMHRVISISLILALIGLVLSMVAPQYFETVAYLAQEEKLLYQSRAYGFSLRANELAITICLLFIGWFSKFKQKNILFYGLSFAVLFIAVMMTGSRTGVLLALFILAFNFMSLLKDKKRVGSVRLLLKIGFTITFLVVVFFGVEGYLLQTHFSSGRERLVDRLERFINFRLTDDRGIAYDRSVQIRLDTQRTYWALTAEKPLLGHGFGSDNYYQRKGLIFMSSHSNMVTDAMEYGVLYPAAILFFLFLIYKNRKSKSILRAYSIEQLVFVSMFLYVTNTTMNIRVFYIVLGMLFSMVWFPKNMLKV